MAKYKWESPLDWFEKRHLDDADDLRELCAMLAGQLDSDQLQDLFQSTMNEDGYFAPEGGDE